MQIFVFEYVNYQQDTENLFRKYKVLLLETLLGIIMSTDLILLRLKYNTVFTVNVLK